MRENEGAIIEVAQDASTSGQFYDYLEDFARTFSKPRTKKKSCSAARGPMRSRDSATSASETFEAFLRKQKFFEYKSHKIAQRLRDIQGESVVLKI